MPVHKCAGGKGYKWGNSGTCYKGPNAKKKAAKQGKAAYAHGYKGGKS